MPHLVRCIRDAVLILGVGLLPSPIPASPGGRIEPMANLKTARAAHTTTDLVSGRLLVVGGMGSGEGSLATAELIDPSTARVEPAASLAVARASHTATALPDGRVVVIGGYNGEYLASVEVFDPARQRFAPMGQLNVGRSGHTATLLHDGRILIAGGVGRGWSFLASAEVFEPATGRSQSVGPLSVPRESHTATPLADGRVLIVGGHQGRREAMEVYSSAEVYDPRTGRFEPTGPLMTARHKHDAVALEDGRVLVIGGADRTDRQYYATTEVYDPAAGSFTPGPTMANTRYKIQGTSVRLTNGDILVSSGARVAELLDARAFTFRAVPGEFPTAYFFATATPIPSGDVVIVGGYGLGVQNTGGVWRFRAHN